MKCDKIRNQIVEKYSDGFYLRFKEFFSSRNVVVRMMSSTKVMIFVLLFCGKKISDCLNRF